MAYTFPWFANSNVDPNHLEGLSDTLDSNPTAAESVGLRWSLRICIFYKFPVDSDASRAGTHFENL